MCREGNQKIQRLASPRLERRAWLGHEAPKLTPAEQCSPGFSKIALQRPAWSERR
jgi:hypothetical protein